MTGISISLSGLHQNRSFKPFTVCGQNDFCVKKPTPSSSPRSATANWLPGLENEQRLARSGGGVSTSARFAMAALPVFLRQRLGSRGWWRLSRRRSDYLTKFASKVYMIHRATNSRQQRS
ncbi:MAG: hypothetical protein R3E58_06655 [Phycisphaerae bacterium]